MRIHAPIAQFMAMNLSLPRRVGSASPQADAPVAAAKAPEATVETDRPESPENRHLDSRHDRHRAAELGHRAKMREFESEESRDDRRAAPGSVRLARGIERAVRHEIRDALRGNAGLDREMRGELREAGRDLHHELRDLASEFTEDDGSFDLAGFLGGAASAIDEFADEIASALGIEPADEHDDEEDEHIGINPVVDAPALDAPTIDGPVVDLTPQLPGRQGDPVPTVDGSED